MPDVISGQAATPAADPVAMISALLDAEKVKPEPPKEVPAEAAQPEGDAEYTPGDNAKPEGEDAQPEGGEKTPVAEIPLDQLEAIELETTYKGADGKDVTEKLPIKALREGYMRQADYTRKTADLARQREEATKQSRQAVETERTNYLQELKRLSDLVIETVAPEFQGKNMNELATTDPWTYVQLDNRQKQIQKTLEQIKSREAEVRAKAEAERGENLKKIVQASRAKLEADIPGFTDELYQKLIQSGTAHDYKPEEVAQWVDPRAIKLLHKAYLYDQMQVAKPAADKKVVNVPKVIKPGATTAVSQAKQKSSVAMERLNQSGRWQDAASVIAERLKL